MSIHVTPARPSYGMFQDQITQTIASTSTAYPVRFRTTDISSGITVGGVNSTHLIPDNAGTYNIQFSFQFANANVSIQDVRVWLRVSGTDITGSAGAVSIPNSHGGLAGALIVGWNYFQTFTQGQYAEIMWSATSTDVSMPHLSAGTSPVSPTAASAIVTVSQVN